jgi:small subunit ribosomal protein S16
MAVKIRMARFGTTNAPVFRIVAVDSRRKRDGACLENLGTYDPVRHELIQFHSDRIQYWISQGAQMSDSVKKVQRIYAKNSK